MSATIPNGCIKLHVITDGHIALFLLRHKLNRWDANPRKNNFKLDIKREILRKWVKLGGTLVFSKCLLAIILLLTLAQ